MQNSFETRFRKRVLLIIIISCALLQLICAVFQYAYAYSIEGTDIDGTTWNIVNMAVSFIGRVSVFFSYGIIGYLVFLYGMHGGEWLIAVVSGYGLVWLLSFLVEDSIFALAAWGGLSLVFGIVYLIWTKSCKGLAAIVLGTMLIPYIGATVTFFAAGSLTIHSIVESYTYCFLNLALDFLLAIVFARICNYFRNKALDKDESADISIGGQFFPKGKPVLCGLFAVNILYSGISVVLNIIETSSLLSEYGAPINTNEWITLITPYIETVIYFAVGYASMYFIASKLENAFIEESSGEN